MGERQRKLAAAMASKCWPGGPCRCPRCLGLRVATADQAVTDFYGRKISVCGDCRAAWEPIDETGIWDRSDLACSGAEPCDNCAFRPGSHEQRNIEEWKGTIASLKAGASFYCHKGVPISPGSTNGFDYPGNARNRVLCRGYLNFLSTRWGKQARGAGVMNCPDHDGSERSLADEVRQ